MMLALCPPMDCHQGKVDVHVAQRSTGREAIVEFSLHGLRVEMSAAIDEGSEVHVFFSWGEVETT